MKNYIEKLKKSNYFSALSILTTGSIVGFVIIALHQILQTHIFTASEIGTFSFLMAVPLMFVGVITLRYDIAIVTEKDNRNALALVKLSAIISIVFSALVAILYLIYILIFNYNYTHYMYILPFVFLLLVGYGFNNTLSSYNNRSNEYKLISSMYVLRTFIQHGGVLLLGYVFVSLAGMSNLSVFIMVMPHSVGLFFGIMRQSQALRRYKDEFSSISKDEMIGIAKIYRHQLFFSTPALLANSFSFSVITIIIEKFYDTIVLGYYSVSSRVLGIPIALVAGNVAKLFIEKASREYNSTGKFINAFKQSVFFLAVISFLMFLGMFFLAPPLCEFAFGKGWGITGVYIRILAPMFSFRLIGTAVSQGLIVCQKQKTELFFNIVLTLASLTSGFITWITKGDITVFLTFLSIAKSLCYIWLTIIVFYYATGKSGQRSK